MAGDLSRKTAAGVRFLPQNRVGPSVVTPQVNRSAQSADAKALEAGSIPIHGAGENSRIIDRGSIQIPSSYGQGEGL